MGIETAVAIGAIVSAVATTVSAISSLSAGSDVPLPEATKPIANEAEKASRNAEDKARRKALAATDQQSTILTSSTGIPSAGRTILGG